jgi:2'-5' RNA ligase
MGLFPEDPPTDLHDAAAITHNDWTAFTRLTNLIDHWARPQWPDGARAYYWMIIPPVTPQLLDLAHSAQAAIGPLGGFDAVPLDGLHLTMHRIGAVESVTAKQAQTAAVQAGQALADLERFDLAVGPLAGSAGAVRFSVTPWAQLTAIHRAIAGIHVGQLKPADGIRPHLSIAYSNRHQAAGHIISTVRQLRDLAIATMVIDQIHLVELQRIAKTYRWTILETIGLRA